MSVFNTINKLTEDRRLRYLAVGGVNALAGYLAGLGLYYSLAPSLHILVISGIANIICISFAFFTYKFFVFKTHGNWLREYFRCYVVYGGSAIFSIVAIWILVDVLRIPFWLAQAGLFVIIAIFSYIAHSRFSFAPESKSEEKGSSHDA